MALFDNDYKFYTNMSLQILKKERKKLYADSTSVDPTISMALYSFGENEKSLQELYIQRYCIEWLDDHWSELNRILDKHDEYTKSERKHFALFFAEQFKALYREICNFNTEVPMIISDMISIELAGIDGLIESSDKWEDKMKSLQAEKKKHSVRFKALIEEAKKNGT